MKNTTEYTKLLTQIKESLDGKLRSNDGSSEFGLLWHIHGLVSRHVPENNTSISQSRTMIKEGMIRQATNNPL